MNRLKESIKTADKGGSLLEKKLAFANVIVIHLCDMKQKSVTLREFQHNLSALSESLKPGESLFVTKRGRPLGVFTKNPKPKKMPDFLANLKKLGHSAKEGQTLIASICELS